MKDLSMFDEFKWVFGTPKRRREVLAKRQRRLEAGDAKLAELMKKAQEASCAESREAYANLFRYEAELDKAEGTAAECKDGHVFEFETSTNSFAKDGKMTTLVELYGRLFGLNNAKAIAEVTRLIEELHASAAVSELSEDQKTKLDVLQSVLNDLRKN